ncbi:PAS domain S-box protein [Natronomonas halophila]|uniref:PAS domain S-box protein n=1 Tax=Natronomonas halophila TaxID=2747817 RepID=UPI0015B39A40|nr:PAS domain S-box protein [Natronomonas halophila]QLD85189.1 PAS domain S-box protein [Natronomonas halophila]
MGKGGRGTKRGPDHTRPDRQSGPVRPDYVLYAVAATYAATGAAAMAGVGGAVPIYEVLFEGFMHVGLAVVVLAGAYYLRRSELPQEMWWSVLGGYVSGIVFLSVLLTWANLSPLLSGAPITSLWDDFVFFGNLGGLFGFVTGVSHARSRYNRHLRQNLEASNELVESAEEALWMFRADWSELLYINSAYEEIHGQPIERLEAEPEAVLETVHPDDRQRTRAAMDQLSNGEPIDIEIRVNAEEGFGRWVWVKGQPVYRDGDLYAVSGLARDITDRKERQRRFEAIFNQTYQFTGLLSPDGTLLEANDTALAFGGITRDDVIGEKVWDAYWFRVSEDVRERAKEAVKQAADGEFAREELEVQGADGTVIIDFSVRPVTDEDGEVTLLVPEGRDITQLKNHERRVVELHETTRRLFRAETKTEAAEVATSAARDLLELSLNTVALYDSTENALRPVVSTPEAEELFGDMGPMGPEDGIGWIVFETGEPKIYDDVSQVPERSNPETPVRSEMVLPLGNHGVFMIGATEEAAFDEQAESLAKLLTTNLEAALDRIEQQRDLEARRRELERQNERLDEFAGVVSHDLRNPLTVAKGRLELMDAESDEDEADENVTAARDALDRMEALIDDLLELARAGEVVDDPDCVDLAGHAETCWGNVETDGATLESDLTNAVWADENRLAQLFENLFRNAVEHGSTSPPSQAQEDTVEHGGDDVTIRVGDLDDGFYIEDDGPGIPPEERDDIFEAGYTTAADGNGFGLSIVQKIVEAQGWTIDVTESESGGARFEIRGVKAVTPHPTNETP